MQEMATASKMTQAARALLGISGAIVMKAAKEHQLVLVGNHPVAGASYRATLGRQQLPLQALQV